MTDSMIEAQRFWSKVNIQGIAECWPWIGHLQANKNGMRYGYFNRNGKMQRAHRVAYEVAYGAIPDGLVVRHDCDNPICVNPNHLRIGTQSDNVRDRDVRGRNANANKTVCKRGHPLSGDNLYVSSRGLRTCKKCQSTRSKKWLSVNGHRYAKKRIDAALSNKEGE